jgi:hypothetical protein
MNSHLLLALVTALALLGLSGCKSRQTKAAEVREQDRAQIQTQLQEEMTLKEDREHLSKLRKDIPPEKQKANDELALFLTLMDQGTEQPNTLRERFTVLVQKKRSAFRDKVEDLRKDFRTKESRQREDFIYNQQKKRDSYMKTKRDSKAYQRFVTDQDRDRSRFFQEQRDRRTAFEAEISAQSHDFNSYMVERQNEFNEQFRLYSKKYSERPKAKKAVTGDDFKRLDSAPANPLGTED